MQSCSNENEDSRCFLSSGNVNISRTERFVPVTNSRNTNRNRGDSNGRSGSNDNDDSRRFLSFGNVNISRTERFVPVTSSRDTNCNRGDSNGQSSNSPRQTNYTPSRSARSRPQYDATLYNFFDGTKYEENFGYSTEVVVYRLTNNQKKKISKSVVDLIDMIFDKDHMFNEVSRYSLDPSHLESNKLTRDLILKALTKLSSITIEATTAADQSFFKKAKKFLSKFPFTVKPNINIPADLGFFVNGLNEILLIRDAFDIITEFLNDPNYYYKYYKKLNTKIRPLETTSDEYLKILQYTHNSHGPTHSNIRFDIVEIFKISRRGEFRKYKTLKDSYGLPKLLWHGTKTTNLPSILLKGLQIAPNQAPCIGNEFGQGIYFTDVVSKAAINCHANVNYPHGILILAEVALGNTHKLTKSQNVTYLPRGKNSVKGLGKYIPNPSGHFQTINGVQVPLGRVIEDTNLTTDMEYNQYVVREPNQVLIQYVVRVKFNF